MKILVIAEEPLSTLLGRNLPVEGLEIIFSATVNAENVDMIIDPFFEDQPQQISIYKECKIPVLIGSVCYTLDELQVHQAPIARFNFWPADASSTLLEISAAETQREKFHPFFEKLGIVPQWLPDEKGFVTPRVIAAIINEAYLAAGEDVASTEDIDTAMQLGTNYPLGPFAWCEKIGSCTVARLLTELSKTNPIYSPAASLRSA